MSTEPNEFTDYCYDNDVFDKLTMHSTLPNRTAIDEATEQFTGEITHHVQEAMHHLSKAQTLMRADLAIQFVKVSSNSGGGSSE